MVRSLLHPPARLARLVITLLVGLLLCLLSGTLVEIAKAWSRHAVHDAAVVGQNSLQSTVLVGDGTEVARPLFWLAVEVVVIVVREDGILVVAGATALAGEGSDETGDVLFILEAVRVTRLAGRAWERNAVGRELVPDLGFADAVLAWVGDVVCVTLVVLGGYRISPRVMVETVDPGSLDLGGIQPNLQQSSGRPWGRCPGLWMACSGG